MDGYHVVWAQLWAARKKRQGSPERFNQLEKLLEFVPDPR